MWWIMVSVAALVGAAASVPCEEARMRCAYRVGCGMALQNYVVGCSGVLQGPPPTYCPEICHHSLIALTSTEEGKDLMNCNCSDEYCEDQKLRSEICRPQVIKTINESVVSCRVAQWICAADALCSTALEYYNHYCRAMFHGKKCSPRCKNSINILRRQEKAAKLTTCLCDGLEDYDCQAIQRNMDRLCFHKHHHPNATQRATPPPPPPPEPAAAAPAPTLALAAAVALAALFVT
ncbi:growth arrest-specific protein 1-like isoform X2 [Zophobas morio]